MKEGHASHLKQHRILQSSEKESNGSEEYTNFIAFAASVNEKPLKKEVLSESLLNENKRVSKKCSKIPHNASESHSWHLDSRCSHHMTRNKSLFTSFIEFDGGNVTFRDGNVARVKDKGTICAPNIPNLEEVLYEGLKANLISTSQMCGMSSM
ncbi:hypothetical protein CK203_104273 [Vitis vinifera]|uniref:Retrovirus-related Pol polyprotein from transposon TNT 1-94-like beta-barrel domain-containing protein n=1 Tax=Vitis vinifera TaxID=29760 RepID=A0A438C5X6_VITVI|nr:hypothetical protein CK203_104273 [Vitis vinifera]